MMAMNLNQDTKIIIQQLQLFAYSHTEIMQAIDNVIDKTDIMAIMEYMDNKIHYKSHTFSPGVDAVVDDESTASDFDEDECEDLYTTKDERISEVILLTQKSFDDDYIYLHSNIWNEPVYDNRNDQRTNILQILDELNSSDGGLGDDDSSDEEDL